MPINKLENSRVQERRVEREANVSMGGERSKLYQWMEREASCINGWREKQVVSMVGERSKLYQWMEREASCINGWREKQVVSMDGDCFHDNYRMLGKMIIIEIFPNAYLRNIIHV